MGLWNSIHAACMAGVEEPNCIRAITFDVVGDLRRHIEFIFAIFPGLIIGCNPFQYITWTFYLVRHTTKINPKMHGSSGSFGCVLCITVVWICSGL